MIRAGILKKIAAMTIIPFCWLCAVQTGLLSGQEDLLRRARQLFQEGDYPKTLALLDEFISGNKGREGQKKTVAEAYYVKAKVYHAAGEEDSRDSNLKLVFETHPEYTMNEPDLEFRELAGKIRSAVISAAKAKAEQRPGGGSAEPKAMGIEAKTPKKFPWLIVCAAAVVVGVAAFLVFKKKGGSNPTTTTSSAPSSTTTTAATTTTTTLTTSTTTTISSSTGNILVTSTPTGAKIYLDNADTEKTTNDTLTSISPGWRAVKLTKAGYKDFQKDVYVVGGSTSALNATLTINDAAIVGSFPSPGSSPTALEWDGSSLWMVDNLKKFYQLDTNGNVLSSFSFSENVYDLAWDGSNLWAYTPSGLKKLDRSGNVLSTLNVSYWYGSGLAWDGTHFWVGDYNAGEIHKIDISGNQLLFFDVSEIDHPTGMAFDGANLLIGDCFQLTNCIYIYSRQGVRVARIDLDSLGLTGIKTFEEKSVAWDGQYIWYSSTGRFTIYKLKKQV